VTLLEFGEEILAFMKPFIHLDIYMENKLASEFNFFS